MFISMRIGCLSPPGCPRHLLVAWAGKPLHRPFIRHDGANIEFRYRPAHWLALDVAIIVQELRFLVKFRTLITQKAVDLPFSFP
jgi:uncharacterized protein (DUF2126 family)